MLAGTDTQAIYLTAEKLQHPPIFKTTMKFAAVSVSKKVSETISWVNKHVLASTAYEIGF